MRPPLASLTDLVIHEAAILDIVGSTAQRTELFLVAPRRFLHDHGFVLADELAERLGLPPADAPEGGEENAALYDAIARGDQGIFGDLPAVVTVNIVALGLDALFAEEPS